MTYNAMSYGEDPERAELVHRVIREARATASAAGDALVVAAQELIAEDPAAGVRSGRGCRRWWPWSGSRSKAGRAGWRLQTLAEATGLRCEYERNRPAVAVGSQRYHPGLMWSEELSPAGGFAAVSGRALWHAYLQVDLDVGAVGPVAHASYHARSNGLRQRTDEAEVVLKQVFRPPHRPTLVGGDWNGVSADRAGAHLRVWDGWAVAPEYDRDPYHFRHGERCQSVDWHREFVFQCKTWTNGDGTLGWEADRSAGRILRDGGLVDAAAALEAPWAATVGHWDGDDVCGPRRLDIVRTTTDVVSALVSCEVIDSNLTRRASDHLPFVVTYAPAAIAAGSRGAADG